MPQWIDDSYGEPLPLACPHRGVPCVRETDVAPQKQTDTPMAGKPSTLRRARRRARCTEWFRKPLGRSSRVVPVLDWKAVEAVRLIYRAISDGMCYGSVARELNRRIYTTLAGRRLYGVVVRWIVTNPADTGDFVLGRQCRGRLRSLREESGIVTSESIHEPLAGHPGGLRPDTGGRGAVQPHAQGDQLVGV